MIFIDLESTIHHSKIAEIAKSKRELWRFMTGDGQAYLPDYANCPV